MDNCRKKYIESQIVLLKKRLNHMRDFGISEYTDNNGKHYISTLEENIKEYEHDLGNFK